MADHDAAYRARHRQPAAQLGGPADRLQLIRVRHPLRAPHKSSVRHVLERPVSRLRIAPYLRLAKRGDPR